MINQILQVIAKAASPSERVEIFFQALSEQSNDILLQRETEWIKHVTGSNTLFQEILQARGISTEAFKKQLYNVKVAEPERLPQWAEVIVELMNPATFTGNPLEPFQSQVNQNKKVELPYQNAFQPFLRLAKQQLETWVSSCNFQVSATAKRKMLGSLLRRFYTVSSQTLTYKLDLLDVLVTGHGKIGYSVYDVFLSQPQVSRSNWLEVFELFPVLAKLLAVVYLNWRNSTTEFLERLTGDYKLLTETFFSGEEPGQLEDINLNAGDVHNQGRTVIIATFANDKKLVYKPKNLSIACSFMELLNFLNSTGQILPLHTRKILPRFGYAWEEYVEFACCKNTNEIRYFYHRIGMILRLLQLLQGRDFHCENLIAFGDHPVLIDLENLFQPSVKNFSAKLAIEEKIFNRLDSSALSVGIISAKEYGEVGCRNIDFGVLAQGQEQVSPYKVTKVETLETGEVRIVNDFVSFQVTNCLPYLQGERANPQDYFDEILTGYRAMNNCLSLNSEELSKEDGIIAKMAGMPIRFLYRSTSKYYRVMQESLAPACLRDSIKREISIERLWKAYLKSYHPLEIIQSEIDAIRNLDIPFFKALIGSWQLLVI
ncbi:MAG: type 2 lanthipeptide synthetase LanM [Nostoc sp.]|uniref:type 2 lanthipeptide synthetase LanM n=1 Tax=Nostoc sp. TaxID=1180 RepID=UPI002FF4C736